MWGQGSECIFDIKGSTHWLPERLIRQTNQTVSRAAVNCEIPPSASLTDLNKENEEVGLPSKSDPLPDHDNEWRMEPPAETTTG